MKIFYSTFLLLLFWHNIIAQQAFISGKITNSKTKESLIGVSVFVDDTLAGSSDINGDYSLTLSEGSHQLRFHVIGFAEKKITAEATSAERKIINVAMEETSTQLNVVV